MKEKEKNKKKKKHSKRTTTKSALKAITNLSTFDELEYDLIF